MAPNREILVYMRVDLTAKLAFITTWLHLQLRLLFVFAHYYLIVLVCLNQKYFFGFGFHFFVSDIVSGEGFWKFWIRLLSPGPKPVDGSFLIKFLLETRLESESFEPFIDFLGFWDQK